MISFNVGFVVCVCSRSKSIMSAHRWTLPVFCEEAVNGERCLTKRSDQIHSIGTRTTVIPYMSQVRFSAARLNPKVTELLKAHQMGPLTARNDLLNKNAQCAVPYLAS